MKLKRSIYIIVYIVGFISYSYAYTSLYNALPQKISINYGEIKQLPIILQSEFDSYTYAIYINGEHMSSNGVIKVYLTTRSGMPLPNPFNFSQLDEAYLVLSNNKIVRVKEAVINIEYFAPLETSHVYSVVIELLPKDKASSYSLANGIQYAFKVYANAFILKSSYGSDLAYESGSEFYYNGYENNEANDESIITHEDNYYGVNSSDVLRHNDTNMAYEHLNDSSITSDKQEIQNSSMLLSKESDFFGNDSKRSYSLDEMHAENASSKGILEKVTGKVISTAGNSTLIILVIGSVILYLLWRKL